MSKIAIILCAVLFASAANAAVSWEKSMIVVQKNVQQVIDNAIAKVEQEFMDTQMKTLMIANELSEGTTKFSEKVWEELSSVTENVTVEVSKLVSEVEGVNVDECLKLSDSLGDAAKAAIVATSSCINGKLKTGYSYIDATNKISNEVLSDVSDIKDKAQHCGDSITNAKSAAEAITCAKSAASDATWISINAAPKLTSGYTKLQFLLVSLQRSLAVCESNSKLSAFNSDASTVVKRTEECINEKVHKSKSATPTFFSRFDDVE